MIKSSCAVAVVAMAMGLAGCGGSAVKLDRESRLGVGTRAWVDAGTPGGPIIILRKDGPGPDRLFARHGDVVQVVGDDDPAAGEERPVRVFYDGAGSVFRRCDLRTDFGSN